MTRSLGVLCSEHNESPALNQTSCPFRKSNPAMLVVHSTENTSASWDATSPPPVKNVPRSSAMTWQRVISPFAYSPEKPYPATPFNSLPRRAM